MKRFLIISLLLVSLTGCGKEKVVEEKDIFSFKYNDMNILLGEEFSRDKYGKELEYFEAPTCAFEDMDRTYTYEHYEINTYTENGQEKVLSIVFKDSDVKTNEGISLGDDFTKLVEVYGDKYKQEDNLYVYEKDKTNLEFIVENDTITNIEYSYDAES